MEGLGTEVTSIASWIAGGSRKAVLRKNPYHENISIKLCPSINGTQYNNSNSSGLTASLILISLAYSKAFIFVMESHC